MNIGNLQNEWLEAETLVTEFAGKLSNATILALASLSTYLRLIILAIFSSSSA